MAHAPKPYFVFRLNVRVHFNRQWRQFSRPLAAKVCASAVVECKRNVMAHAQKPDSVFQRNGRVHLYRRGCKFSRVLAFLECGSGENDCSNTGWTVPSQTEACLATHSIRLPPLHFSSRASPCATRFRFHSNAGYTMFRGSVKGTGYPLHSPVSPLLPLLSVTVCHHISTGF